jgi:4-amino-4-deoxy-L-arabinose transferase-like glycosyltransferase
MIHGLSGPTMRKQQRSRRLPDAAPARTPPRRTAAPGAHACAPGWRLWAVALIAAVCFTSWQVVRANRQSATWDEPIHLTAGFAALTQGDFRVDPSHPPLIRMWAALPLTIAGASIDTTVIDGTPATEWLPRGYAFAREFLFGPAGGDASLLAARAMVIAWGAGLGLLVFWWGYEWLGATGAMAALALYLLEPNLAAHSALVTTDFAVTALTFAMVFFLWRLSRRMNPRDLAAMAGCAAAAIVTKFSAVILAPILVALLAAAVAQRRLTLRQAGVTAGVTAAAVFLAIWAAYGFRHAPSPDPGWLFPPGVNVDGGPLSAIAPVVDWLDRRHLLPNAFAQGFLVSLSSARELPAFLAGTVKVGGWWYYFPVALVLKTPLALLLLALTGAAFVWRRRDRGALDAAFVIAPTVIWMAVAATSGVNLGVRHILPIYPFIILIAAAGASALLARPGATRMVAAAAVLAIAVEVGRAEPYPLSFFNTLAGGPAHGSEYLADSNLGWGGNLKALKRWMDEHGVATVNLAYFGSVDPATYGIRVTHLPSSATFLADRFAKPQLPGYVAISSTVLDGVYLPEWWRHFYAGFRDREPVAVLANSMRVYWVDRWPEAAASPIGDEPLQILAEGLLFGLGWPEHAAVHYRQYLEREPDSAEAWKGLSLALARGGRTTDALDGFRRVLTLSPSDADARRNVAILERQVELASSALRE